MGLVHSNGVVAEPMTFELSTVLAQLRNLFVVWMWFLESRTSSRMPELGCVLNSDITTLSS